MGGTGARRALGIACALVCASCMQTPAAAPEAEAGSERPDLETLVYDPPADLPAPEQLSATDGQYRQIPLQWDPVLIPLVAGYLVESSDAGAGPFRPRQVLPHRGALAWLDRGEPEAPLGDGATRHYRVRAFDHEGRVSSNASATVAGTTAPPVAPPTDLRAYSRQPRSIPLAWSPAEDPIVSGYVVERSPDPDGPFDVVAELAGRHTTHFLDTGLGDLAVLFYRVSSLNPGGERGPPSEVLRAVTKPPPLPPIGLRVVEQRLGVNVLAWEPNVERDLESYRLVRLRPSGGVEPVMEVDASLTRARDTAVGAGERVSYAVIAVDQDGLASRASEPVRVAGLGYEWIARANSAGVRLAWNPRLGEGFDRARVTRAGWLAGWTRTVDAEAGLLDQEVQPGRRHRYRIQLLRPDGPPGPPSQPVEIEVPEAGDPFVEIRAPASRLARPEGVPR